MKESPRLTSKDDTAGLFIAAGELDYLVTKNVEALRQLYDEERGVFSYRVYIDSYPRLLNLS